MSLWRMCKLLSNGDFIRGGRKPKMVFHTAGAEKILIMDTPPDGFAYQSLCGQGAYSKVFCAKRTSDSRLFAVKCISIADPDDAAVVHAEIDVLRRVANEEWAVQLVEARWSVVPSVAFIVLDYHPCTLHHVIQRTELPFAHKQMLTGRLVDAVAKMHERGIIHCDLKPANILITIRLEVKIADFGMSCLGAEAPAWRRGYVVTRWYRAPELLVELEADTTKLFYGNTIDVWALGCIIGEVHARKAIFAGDSTAKQKEIIVTSLGTDLDASSRSIHRRRFFDALTIDPLVHGLLEGFLQEEARLRRTASWGTSLVSVM